MSTEFWSRIYFLGQVPFFKLVVQQIFVLSCHDACTLSWLWFDKLHSIIKLETSFQASLQSLRRLTKPNPEAAKNPQMFYLFISLQVFQLFDGPLSPARTSLQHHRREIWRQDFMYGQETGTTISGQSLTRGDCDAKIDLNPPNQDTWNHSTQKYKGRWLYNTSRQCLFNLPSIMQTSYVSFACCTLR